MTGKNKYTIDMSRKITDVKWLLWKSLVKYHDGGLENVWPDICRGIFVGIVKFRKGRLDKGI
jgi:hypothetical protein